jgi:hypothetical protein
VTDRWQYLTTEDADRILAEIERVGAAELAAVEASCRKLARLGLTRDDLDEHVRARSQAFLVWFESYLAVETAAATARCREDINRRVDARLKGQSGAPERQ